MFADGTDLVDLLHVEDATAAIIAALRKPVAGTWNVGSGGYTVNDIIDHISAALPVPMTISRSDRPRLSHYLDTAAFRDTFGIVPKVPIAEGIAKEIAFHRALGWTGAR